jgi:hypothetical protein
MEIDMKLHLMDPRGKKLVYEMEAPPEVARLLVRRDQSVTFQGVQYGFMSSTKERNRYAPMLPPVQLEEEMLVGSDSGTGQ